MSGEGGGGGKGSDESVMGAMKICNGRHFPLLRQHHSLTEVIHRVKKMDTWHIQYVTLGPEITSLVPMEVCNDARWLVTETAKTIRQLDSATT